MYKILSILLLVLTGSQIQQGTKKDVGVCSWLSFLQAFACLHQG